MGTVKVGLLATITAKPGKEQEVAELLASAVPLAEAETETVSWFAFRIDERRFGIFDVFADEHGRTAHLNGPIAAALMAKADELLADAPKIEQVGVLGAKLA
jgi:quinol monooxygenase YgiN